MMFLRPASSGASPPFSLCEKSLVTFQMPHTKRACSVLALGLHCANKAAHNKLHLHAARFAAPHGHSSFFA